MDMSFRTLAALCSLAITMNTGCTDNSRGSSEGSVTPLMSGESSESETVLTPERAEESDYTPAAAADTSVVFSGNKASVKGRGAAVSGSTVTITAAGVYEVSGKCSDGKIIVDADKESSVTLLLNGLELTCKSGSAIDCEKAEKLLLTAAEGTMNTLSDSESYSLAQDETEPDAAVFCRSDMVINGGGSLAVTGLYSVAGGNVELYVGHGAVQRRDKVQGRAQDMRREYHGERGRRRDSRKGLSYCRGGSAGYHRGQGRNEVLE